MASILVTGTNQGIGFGIVEQLAKRDDVDHVFATVRDPTGSSSSELQTLASSLPKIHIIKLELSEASAAVRIPLPCQSAC
jgi:NAD(P)-dependent dehydrogenase (short-subunit alcohol dehydrogenase family)